MTETNPPATDEGSALRAAAILAEALGALTGAAIEGCALEAVVLYGTYTDGRGGYVGDLRRDITPADLRTLLAERDDAPNQAKLREHWYHAPPSSPYTRLHDYGEGEGDTPSREDVMELLRSFNAATAMNGVHKRTIGRQWEQLDLAKRALDAAKDGLR